jgi:hypothetical protein
MAEMLLLHAQRVETVESPLDALRAGNPQRALKLAERILREQDYQRGTLWLLLLAWESCIRENGAEFATQCLNQIRDWWHANRPQPLDNRWGTVVANILPKLQGVQVAALGIILQDAQKLEIVRGLLESGLCLAAGASRASVGMQRSGLRRLTSVREAYGAVALALAQAGQTEQALGLCSGRLRMPTAVRRRIVRW